MLPLPTSPSGRSHAAAEAPRCAADCFVVIDTIRYSVPYKHVRETVEVVVDRDQVEIGCAGTIVAQHVRCS